MKNKNFSVLENISIYNLENGKFHYTHHVFERFGKKNYLFQLITVNPALAHRNSVTTRRAFIVAPPLPTCSLGSSSAKVTVSSDINPNRFRSDKSIQSSKIH